MKSISLKRIAPIIRKEFRQIVRDRRSLGLLLGVPAFLLIFIGYALNFDVKHISVVVFDQDKSSASREFIGGFSTSGYFDLKFSVSNESEINHFIDDGLAHVAIVVPEKFSHDINAGRDVSVQILVDGSDANTATTSIGYINAIVQSYSSHIAANFFARSGVKAYVPIDVRPKIWYNPELATAKFLVPGLIGFILMLTAVISTSLSVVKEKEQGTMEHMMVSPLRTAEVVIGKTLPYLVIAFVSAVLVLAAGYVLFDVTIRGSFFWLFVAIILFLVGALGQGLLISTVADTQQVAFMLAIFSSLLPTFLLSGFIFPIRNMPLALQIISNISPAKFFLTIVRSIILKGTGPEIFWTELLAIALFATVMLTLSAVRLSKREA